jgi:argininosuccinate lyase
MKLWGGRFEGAPSELFERFSGSLYFDRRLIDADLRGSQAYARALEGVGILTAEERQALVAAFEALRSEARDPAFYEGADDEDVHTLVIRKLGERAGKLAEKIHTGRSRNDQVSLDLRLWLRDEIDAIRELIAGLIEALLAQAAKHAALVMPGLTHLQVAQPVTFGHHLLAYVEMLERDRERLAQCRGRVNRLPLGAAALAGTSFPIDRSRVARELGFEGLCENSLDAVADRDFAIEFCADAALVMVHLSRLAEELVLWVSPRFGFVRLPDRYLTGSSIMPQKKNPDVPELVRGKSGRVFGSLVALLALMKGQPLAYNRDNQEDKEPLFDAVDTVKESLAVFAGLVAGLEPAPAAMHAAVLAGHATATDLADYLVRKGMPFRDAHEVVARAVREAEISGRDLAALPLESLRRFSPRIAADVKRVLTPEGSVAARRHRGGTAPAEVRKAVARARKRLSK